MLYAIVEVPYVAHWIVCYKKEIVWIYPKVSCLSKILLCVLLSSLGLLEFNYETFGPKLNCL